MIENTKPEQSALKLGQLILQFLVEDTEQFWLQIVKRSRSLRKLVCLRLDWFEDDGPMILDLPCSAVCTYILTYISTHRSAFTDKNTKTVCLRLKGLNSENPLLEKVTPFQHQVSGARLCFRAGELAVQVIWLGFIFYLFAAVVWLFGENYGFQHSLQLLQWI